MSPLGILENSHIIFDENGGGAVAQSLLVVAHYSKGIVVRQPNTIGGFGPPRFLTYKDLERCHWAYDPDHHPPIAPKENPLRDQSLCGKSWWDSFLGRSC